MIARIGLSDEYGKVGVAFRVGCDAVIGIGCHVLDCFLTHLVVHPVSYIAIHLFFHLIGRIIICLVVSMVVHLVVCLIFHIVVLSLIEIELSEEGILRHF